MRVTQACLDEYRGLIQDAKADLQAHLLIVESKLTADRSGQSGDDLAIAHFVDQQYLQQERRSAIQCLQICSETAVCIENLRQSIADVDEGARHVYQTPASPIQSPTRSSKDITASALDYCHQQLNMTQHGVQARLRSLEEALETRSQSPSINVSERQRIQDCLSLCEEALHESNKPRQNTYDSISAADDCEQFLISTVGELISAKNVTTGARSVQFFGQASNETMQAYFASRGRRQLGNSRSTAEND